jgi:transcriptional repressor NrdR
MRCPYCDADKDQLKVIDSRSCDGGKAIRRRRHCVACGKRFTTYERAERRISLIVVKRDGRRQPWDRDKILAGLERACFKRPIAEGDLIRIRDEVEEELFNSPHREVSTDLIGRRIAGRLRKLDQVAYVRFASVHKRFKTLDELAEEVQAVRDAEKLEDPEQGRLFGEDQGIPENGNPVDEPAQD